MRLVDANILIYAYDKNSPHHEVCRSWLAERLASSRKLGIPWHSLLAFARIVSNPRIYQRPVTPAQAWEQAERWLTAASVFVPEPMRDHSAIMKHILGSHTLSANDIPDAHLAALAMEHGLILCSTDSDFAKYRDIRWENPVRV